MTTTRRKVRPVQKTRKVKRIPKSYPRRINLKNVA